MDKESSPTLILGSCTFEPSTLSLRDAAGTMLSLRSQSLRVLVELARTPGQLVSRDALIEAVWSDVAVTDDSLVQCIKDVRGAIADTDRNIIKTVVGQGYLLDGRLAADTMGMLPTILLERFRAADGIAEDLSEALFEELLIRLSPRSGMRIVTDPERGSDARYMISGRVSERSGTVRIFLNIAKCGVGSDIHASREEAAGAAIWDLPGRVADMISAQLRVHMITGDGSEFASREDKGLSTQELMAKAAWHMARLRRENWYVARAALEQAARQAPDNPIALSMLASMETQMIPLIPFSDLSPDLDRIMAICERAVELDHSNDYVLRTRGNLRLWRLGDHEGACLDCRRALAINPSFHLAHLTIATSEIFTGGFEAGALRLEEMMRRVPFDFQNPLYLSLIALARLLGGKDDEAIAAAREGHERNPLGGWNALVFAVSASECEQITGSSKFRKMVDRIELAPSHFLDLPIRDRSLVEYLASRALAAGVSEDTRA